MHTYPEDTLALAFSVPPQPDRGQRCTPPLFRWPGIRGDPPCRPNATSTDVIARAITNCSRTNSWTRMVSIPPTDTSMATYGLHAIALRQRSLVLVSQPLVALRHDAFADPYEKLKPCKDLRRPPGLARPSSGVLFVPSAYDPDCGQDHRLPCGRPLEKQRRPLIGHLTEATRPHSLPGRAGREREPARCGSAWFLCSGEIT